MRDTVHDHIKKSIISYANEVRTKWVLEWPGQVVLAVTQIYWTGSCTP